MVIGVMEFLSLISQLEMMRKLWRRYYTTKPLVTDSQNWVMSMRTKQWVMFQNGKLSLLVQWPLMDGGRM